MHTRRLQSSLLIILYVLSAVFALPALLLGLLLRFWADATQCAIRDRWQAVGSFAALGLLTYCILWWLWHPLDGFTHAALTAFRLHAWARFLLALFSFWLVNTLLAPVVALLVGGVIRLTLPSRLVKGTHLPPVPSAVSTALPALTSLQDEETLTFSDGSYRGYDAVSSAPPQVRGRAVVGHPLGGDLDWIEEGWFVLPEEALCEHGVICGGTGSGKTSFAIRLASLVRSVYDWRVYYLDSKADDGTAAQFVTEMERLGTRVRAFPQEPMDGWRGSSGELRNRLMQLLTYSERYYKDGARLLLGLALEAPGGTPRSSRNFLRRLDQKVLEALYKGTPRSAQLKRIPSVHVDGTMVRYESFFTSARALLDGSWSWEDTQAAYIALDSLGERDDTQALGRFLIEDFGHFIKQRKPKSERALLILEEFSALAEEVDVTNLFQRIRSAGGSVFVITQGDAGLGQQADKLFQACANIVVFQGSDPDALIRHAGTRLVPDFSHHRPSQRSDRSETNTAARPGGTTLRMREQPKINANEVRQLNTGEGFFIFKGQVQKVQVERLRHPTVALEATQQRLRQLQNLTEAPLLPSPSSLPPAPTSATRRKSNNVTSTMQGGKGRQETRSCVPSPGDQSQVSSPADREDRKAASAPPSSSLPKEDVAEAPAAAPPGPETTGAANAEGQLKPLPKRKGRGLFDA